MKNKNIPNILSIENSFSLCSVCVNKNKKLFYIERLNYNNSSKFILNIINYVLIISKISIPDLNLISFGIGPGNFTNMRIITAVIQSLLLQYKIPVIKMSALETMAFEAFYKYGVSRVFVSLDSNINNIFYTIYVYYKKNIVNIFKYEIKSNINNVVIPYKNIVGIGNGCYVNKKKLCKENNLNLKYNLRFPKAIYNNLLTFSKINLTVFTSININPKSLD